MKNPSSDETLKAITDGTSQAIWDLVQNRDVSTFYAITEGVTEAVTAWLDAHTAEIITAIAEHNAES